MHQKNKTTSKLIAVLLAVVLVATMVPAIAFATGGEEPVNAGNEQGLEGGAGEVTGGSEGDGTEESAGGENADIDEVLQQESEELLTQDLQDDAVIVASEITPQGEEELTTQAVQGTFSASIAADNGTVDLGGTEDTAVMSYSNITNHIPKDYNLTIRFEGLDLAKAHTLSISLARGMKFKETEDYYLGLNPQFAGVVDSADYVNGGVVSRNDGTANTYTFPSGTYSYTLKKNTEASFLSIPITYDPAINTDTISYDAVRVDFSDGDETISEALEIVKRETDGFCGRPSYPDKNEPYLFAGGDSFELPSGQRAVKTTLGNGYRQFITGGTYKLKITDQNSPSSVRMKINNTDTTGEWVIAESNVALGEYTFVYTPTGGYIFSTSTAIPFEIAFDTSPTVAWSEDEELMLTYVAEDTALSYLQYTKGTPTENIGSTVSLTSAAMNINKDAKIHFKYQAPKEKVWVNYVSNSAYLAESNPSSAIDQAFSADIERADANPTLNEEIGTLGIFQMGNAGTVESSEKTVEMTFDSKVYGVMAVTVPYYAGERLVYVEYTSTNEPDWVGVNVNVPTAANGTAYLSYANLRITDRNEYITGLRYSFGKIPAGTTYIGGSIPGMPYYGKWLADSTSTATGTATIEVYDTEETDRVTTGVGITATSQASQSAVGTPNPVEAVVTAGKTLQFNVPILSTTNTHYRNAINEHPVIYIRSEVKDEKGIPLPVTGISLSNDKRVAGEIDQGDLVITSWKVDASGAVVEGANSPAHAIIYKIDTSAVPASKIALLAAYIDNQGRLSRTSLTLSYQIPTTPRTPTQDYFARDMVYVLDKEAISMNSNSGIRRVTSGADYEGIRHGENWTTGVLMANSDVNTKKYQVTSKQEIVVASQIKHITASDSDWSTYTGTPIPVGISDDPTSGFQLKTDIYNGAGVSVTAADVFIPIPKVGEDWGDLSDQSNLSLILKGAASTIDPAAGSGAIGSYSVTYGIEVEPTDDGIELRGETWVAEGAVSDWSKVNCVRITANNIENEADLRVILDVRADESTTVEGLIDVWRPIYNQNFTTKAGDPFSSWSEGADFGVQSALSSVKGQLFLDEVPLDGLYALGEEVDFDASSWKIRVYLSSDTTAALQEVSLAADGSYAIHDLVSSGGEEYILEVINDDPTSYMFTRTAARTAANFYTGNTFVSTDEDVTGIARGVIAEFAPAGIVPNSATYNIGIADLALTTHTWMSADTTKGTVTGDSVTLTARPSVSILSEAVPSVTTEEGYTFTGWVRVDANSTAPAWDATPTSYLGATATISSFGSGSGTYGYDAYDYYAVFSLNSHDISYEYTGVVPQGAPAAPSGSLDVDYGTTGLSVASKPPMTGYTLSDWETTDVTVNADGSFTMPDNDVSFTATWTLNTHDIEYKYIDNPVTGLSAPADALTQIAGYGEINVEYGTTDIPVEAAPSLAGYTFTGWTISGATLETDGSLTMPDNNVVFTGYWALNTYNITYKEVPSGATNTNPATYTTETSNITFGDLAQNARPGYTFDGWTIAEDTDANGANSVDINIADTPGNNTKGVVLETGSYGHITATAQWSINDYTVSFNLNGGANSAADYSELTVTYNSVIRSVAGFPANPAKTGYTFAGWKMSTEGNPMLASTTTMPAENITLTAQWDPAGVSYTVYHHRVDANGSVSATEKETRTALTGSTVNAQAKNYAPSHTYNATYQGTVATGTVQADGSLELRLYYPINRYTVTFVDWIGSVLASRQVPHGGNALAPASPYRAGYAFAGWDKAFNNVTSNLTVNARYTVIPIATYTVTFVDWDGSVLSSQTVTRGGSATAPANPTRTGYTFTGWDRGYTNVTSNITVTAQYTPVEVDTFTITFISYGDTVLQSSSVERGGSVTPPADPTRTGYTFTGWDKTLSAWTNVTADATIRAEWQEITTGTTVTPIPNDPDEDEPRSEEQQIANQTGNPFVDIAEGNVPLGGLLYEGAWSLLSLILVALALISSLLLGIFSARRGKNQQKNTDRNEYVDASEKEDEQRRVRNKNENKAFVVGLIAILVGIVALIVWFLLDDLTQPMVWINSFTVIVLIIFAVHVVLVAIRALLLQFGKQDEDQVNQETQTQAV